MPILSNAYAQSKSSPDAYKPNLWGLFDKFALSVNPPTLCFQVMFMVQGLCDEYDQPVFNFRNGRKKFMTKDLVSVTAWCKNFDKDTYKDPYKDCFKTADRRHP